MSVFNTLQSLISNQKPFVCYFKPNEMRWQLGVQSTDDVHLFIGQSGFVFMPFDSGDPVVIPFDAAHFSYGILDAYEECTFTECQTATDQKETFEKLVATGIATINEGILDKVVLSRKLTIPGHFSILASFKNIINTYPTAFRYLFFHPKIGVWLGASPEQLVQIKKDQFETVALAGTKLVSDAVDWTPKEMTEQKIVIDYIVSKISARAKNIAVSEPQTIQAGNLAHLKSVITGQLTADFSALDLITTLHPTPAVCGLPKATATAFILENENYNRSYYSGFLGEYNSQDATDLFVNLRCMQWEKEVVHVYVGCGITADSDPKLEYIETENKSMTMRNVLVKINNNKL